MNWWKTAYNLFEAAPLILLNAFLFWFVTEQIGGWTPIFLLVGGVACIVATIAGYLYGCAWLKRKAHTLETIQGKFERRDSL